MAEEDEVPDGAAVFPDIPVDVGVSPLLLAALHAVVFLAGSADEIINPAAGEEALQSIAEYLQRLEGDDLERVKADLKTLRQFAREQKWPKALQEFVKTFLADFGIERPES